MPSKQVRSKQNPGGKTGQRKAHKNVTNRTVLNDASVIERLRCTQIKRERRARRPVLCHCYHSALIGHSPEQVVELIKLFYCIIIINNKSFIIDVEV